MLSPHITRRRLLGWPFGLALALRVEVALAAVMPSSAAAQARLTACMGAFLDTLIPADETPAATGLGVERVILAKAARRRQYRGLLQAGCGWLDREARRAGSSGGFAEADEDARIAITERAAGSDPDSLPRTFFDRLRDDAMFVYYAHPQVWPSMGFAGPPQPAGYLDHAAPPRAGSVAVHSPVKTRR